MPIYVEFNLNQSRLKAVLWFGYTTLIYLKNIDFSILILKSVLMRARHLVGGPCIVYLKQYKCSHTIMNACCRCYTASMPSTSRVLAYLLEKVPVLRWLYNGSVYKKGLARRFFTWSKYWGQCLVFTSKNVPLKILTRSRNIKQSTNMSFSSVINLLIFKCLV